TEVEALFARVKQEQGRMDLLVNNAWGGYEQHDHRKFSAPFYEQPMRHWNGMFTAGVRATLLASRIGAPLMMGQRHGLIVNITAILLASDVIEPEHLSVIPVDPPTVTVLWGEPAEGNSSLKEIAETAAMEAESERSDGSSRAREETRAKRRGSEPI